MSSAAAIAPAPVPAHQLASHADAVFEQPPEAFVKDFEVLFPIMARLPAATEGEALSDALGNSDRYLQPQPNISIPGTLPYSSSHSGVTYTVSRLPRIDSTQRELWKALHSLRPLTRDYAGDFQAPARRQKRAPHPVGPNGSVSECPFVSSRSPSSQTALDLVRRAFNWSSIILPEHISGSFYGVVFRSKRAPGSESTNLYTADRLAHEEAVSSGGLLMYFYGSPDPITGSNLATCVWTSRAEALAASALPLHAKAVVHARKAYASFELSRYRLTKLEGETTLRVEECDGEE